MPYNPEYEDFALDLQNVKEGEELLAFARMGDGVNYSRGIGWQSPEGNLYGHTRMVRDWIVPIMWDGIKYNELQLSGLVARYSELPDPSNYRGELWGVLNGKPLDSTNDAHLFEDSPYDIYFYDSETGVWKKTVWLHDIDGPSNIPYPGIIVGGCHRVGLKDVTVFWDGFIWRRPRHSNLDNDEPERHVPAGFISLVPSDVTLVHKNITTLELVKTVGGSGSVWVGGNLLAVDSKCSVMNTAPVLSFSNGSITASLIEQDTEYWVYIADVLDTRFFVAGIDFRGRLFLSKTAPIDESWGQGESARIGRLAGRIETDFTSYAEGGPHFRKGLNISLISRKACLQEAFKDYSDYYIDYISSESLMFRLMDGYHGQIYIPEELAYIGSDREISASDYWVSIDEDTLLPTIETGVLLANTEYFIYIVNEVDQINFNAINANNGRPWGPFDRNSADFYNPLLDLRLKPFLCSHPHTHFRLTDTWPLFYSRCLGHVHTDANGRLLYAKDISYIKSLVLNPTHFKGQADFAIQPVDTSTFHVAAVDGTAGVVYVGGETMFTLPATYNDVHQFSVEDSIQLYTEANVSSPLSDLTKVKTHPSTTFYIYLANSEICWGVRANKLFASTIQPINGYLSVNYPGTCARWIATIKTDSSGLLTGYWLFDSPGKQEAALLNLNDIAVLLSNDVNNISEHDSMIDYLFGWNSGIVLGLGSYASELWEEYSGLSVITDNLWSDWSGISEVASGLDSVVSEMSQQISGLDSDIVGIYSDVNTLRGTESDLLSNITLMSGNVSGLRSDVSGAQSAIIGIQSSVSGILSEEAIMRSNISNAASNINVIVATASALDSGVIDLWSEVGAAQINISGLSTSVSAIGGNISSLSQIYTSLHSNTSTLGVDIDSLKSFQSLFTSDMWGLLSDADLLYSLQSGLASQIADLSVFDSGLNSLMGDLSDYEGRFQSNYSLMSDVISLMSFNIEYLVSDHQYLLNLHYMLEIDESALRSDYEVMSHIQVSLTDTISNIQSDTVDLYSITLDITSDASNLLTYINSLSGVASLLSGGISGLGSGLTNLTSDFSGLNEDLFSLNALTSADMSNVWSHMSNISLDLSDVWNTYGSLSGYTSNLSLITGSLYLYASNLFSDIGAMSGKLGSLSSDVLTASGLVSGLGSQLTLMNSDLGHQSALLNSLSVADSALGSNIAMQASYTSLLSGVLNSLSGNLSGYTVTLGSLQSYTVSLSGMTSNMSQTALSLSSIMSGVSGRLNTMSALTVSLSGNISNLSGVYTAISGNVSGLSGTLSNLGSNYLTTSGLVSTLGLNISAISQTAIGLTSNTAILSGRADALVSNLGAISGNLNTISAYTVSLSAKTSDLSGYLNDASGRVNSLNSNYLAISANYNTLSLTTGSLSARLNDASLRVGSLNSLTSGLNDWTSQLNSYATDMSFQLSGADSQLHRISGTVWSLDSYVSQLSSNLDGGNTGYVGTVPALVTYDWIGKRFKFEDQKGFGLPVRLNYATDWYFTMSVLDNDTQVAFVNGGLLNLTYGSTLHFNLDSCAALTPGVFYYIYLKCAPTETTTLGQQWVTAANWYISATPPTRRYTASAVGKSGAMDYEDSYLIGYMMVSSTNRMGGSYNLWSVYFQPEQNWSFPIYGSNQTTYVNGIIRPSSGVAMSSWRGGASSYLIRGQRQIGANAFYFAQHTFTSGISGRTYWSSSEYIAQVYGISWRDSPDNPEGGNGTQVLGGYCDITNTLPSFSVPYSVSSAFGAYTSGGVTVCSGLFYPNGWCWAEDGGGYGNFYITRGSTSDPIIL